MDSLIQCPRLSAFICGSIIVSGCTLLGDVKFPDPPAQRAAAAAPQAPQAPTGGIYQAATYRPLFEDIRARQVGDVLTVQLVEKTSASRKSSSSTNRDGSTSVSIGDMLKLPLKSLQGMNFDGKSAGKFDGKGETASDILLTGSITVTVIEVLPNGNLSVAGEKQIGVNRNVERLKLAGVVHPASIVAGNVVSSTQVADARIEVSGSGILNETQTMGWAQRVFMSIWPL
jgi:flagellar L-ring protein FlgH